MSENTEEKTLLQSLLDCFSASSTMIKYVFEQETNGKKRYELPLANVVDWWKIVFSKDIVSLSVAPRSHDKQINKDTLSAFVRCIVNDKNKSVVEKNIIPHLKGTRCQDIISGEVSHLEHTIDLGVRAKYSRWDSFSQQLPEEQLKNSADVRIYYEDAVRFLMQLFYGTPYHILLKEYTWFAEYIDSSELAHENYSTNQILSIFACSLMLCLSISEVPEINANIEAYIKTVLSSNEESHKTPPSKSENHLSNKSAPPLSSTTSTHSELDATIRNAGLKINLYEVREGRKPLRGEDAEPIIRDIIDSIMADVYADILGISAQVWVQYNIERKALSICRVYDYEVGSIRELSQTDTNTRL